MLKSIQEIISTLKDSDMLSMYVSTISATDVKDFCIYVQKADIRFRDYRILLDTLVEFDIDNVTNYVFKKISFAIFLETYFDFVLSRLFSRARIGVYAYLRVYNSESFQSSLRDFISMQSLDAFDNLSLDDFLSSPIKSALEVV